MSLAQPQPESPTASRFGLSTPFPTPRWARLEPPASTGLAVEGVCRKCGLLTGKENKRTSEKPRPPPAIFYWIFFFYLLCFLSVFSSCCTASFPSKKNLLLFDLNFPAVPAFLLNSPLEVFKVCDKSRTEVMGANGLFHLPAQYAVT